MNLDLQKVLPAEAFETEQNEGDYIGKDGLLYCGVCRTKKQTRLPASDFTGGREIIVPCICKCKVEENKRKEEEEKKRQEMQRLERLKASSLMDAKLKAARLDGYQVDGDNQKIYNLAGNYVKRFDEMYEKRQGLLFWGTVGTGKSYTAACIANELLDQMIPVEERIMAGLNVAKLLIIDDLGAERSTDYALEKVYNIIDSRYLSGKPLILTTNMTLKDMQESEDIRYRRIYDRIFEMCFPVRFAGRSWREKAASKRFDAMKNLMEE